MEVRRATEDDAEGIARVHIETWQIAYAHAFPADALAALSGTLDDRTERWRRNTRTSDVFVAVDDGELIGFASCGPSRDEAGSGELYGLYAAPARWGTGAGRALIECVERELAERYETATLWVLDDNPRARRFYEAAGWRLDGAQKVDTHLGVDVAEVRYRKELR